ncbi:hypothetical protein FOC1_g10011189 [Fusarium oxysporum f. sp. cubense race 1]|uniref:F-box domain-containing protein n=1 Tax=Fusarium oxysporum f. sp. cubense (strain race 1) TaxID=1229664 RepID=N4UF50_FUSC1|nr:hypothetical protein FOC1_g10011189 [Fusarium oxysporum f. sp. cubense race 1]
MAAEATGNEAATPPKRRLTFLDLPAETQQDILSHCSQSELICCALVSRHFHELASAQLYRSFNILFPDDDDVRFESPIDGLAGGLDTFTTSDYNYAKHLRELSMDTVSTGVKAEHAYKPYLYSASCGKFLNTLLYLTLKKAKSLESFRWNIRVELSRPVFRELHKIKTLTKFHIRLQAGDTYYITPPPLPLSIDPLPPASTHWPDIPPPPPGPPPGVFSAPLAGAMASLPVITSPPPLLPPPKQSSKAKGIWACKLDDRHLTQIRTILMSMMSFKWFPFPRAPASTRAALRRHFAPRKIDVEPFITKKPALIQSPREAATSQEDDQEAGTNDNSEDPREEFVSSIRSVSTRLMSHINGTRDFSTAQQDILDVIEKAARKYVDSCELSSQSNNEPSGSTSATPKNDEEQQSDESGGSKPTTTESSLTPLSKNNDSNNDASPDDIEIEHLDTIDELEVDSDEQQTKDIGEKEVGVKESETPEAVADPSGLPSKTRDANADPSATPGLNKVHTNLDAQRVNYESLLSNLQQLQDENDAFIQKIKAIRVQETLSIHLIPVKASVLSRAIDLKCIKNLTLLNVGNQGPIWTLLSKENKVSPLALRSVFTDNVSTAFLNCMSQLEELHDLFLLERSAKHKPESFAPRTTVTIDQIRRLVLRKHMHTLKRLMIKDESNSSSWDANQKAMILICNRGVQLEELALSMNIHAVHAFMQYFAGLVNLRAINILRFRNNDTCIWVMREILNFIVDNLSHHPELKLEWIAMEDDRLDRVIRPTDAIEEGEKRRDKGKEKATVHPHHNSSNLPVLPSWGSDSESEEDDDDASNCGKRLRLKTVGVLQFYEVWGVKIFDKEIRSGRL